MNVTKFLETMCRLLSEQEGVKIRVEVVKNDKSISPPKDRSILLENK